jgi:alpha-L-fucosidase
MKLNRILFPVCLFFILKTAMAQPVPTKAQLQWQDMELNLFFHFGPNTFTDAEWGSGKEKTEIFNPVHLDCMQWCKTARAAGAKGVIITAKHHDGFCLWPSNYSKHTVRQSSWKNGKGDVLKELSVACKKTGLQFGVYISPWDRNHPDYGTPRYNDIFTGMLKELFTGYGPIFELWWDGANGEGPNGKRQEYDWKRFESFVRKISPQTVIFSDIGPDIRWVGNEEGIAGITNYNKLDTIGFGRGAAAPKQDTLTTGNKNGKCWIPAECDVSIRPGWFYHASENDRVKSALEIFNLYCKSVNRGAVLLLNVPPAPDGRIYKTDRENLKTFKKLKDSLFAKNLALKGKGYLVPHNGNIPLPQINDGNTKTSGSIAIAGLQSMGIRFHKPEKINTVIIREDLEFGQHCLQGSVLLMNARHELLREIPVTTIGRKKMIRFPETTVSIIGFSVKEQIGLSSFSEIEAYHIADRFFR